MAHCSSPYLDKLLHHDPFMLMADYQSYIDCQQAVSQAYCDTDHWTRMSIINSVRMGKFSSDRSIQEYCDEIWKVSPFSISLNAVLRADGIPANDLTCKLGQ
jgi:starch phosphorylase